MRVVTGQEMAQIDRHTITELGLPGLVLMENAGRAVYRAARREWPQARTFSILCGPGNNGGDGFVLARTLMQNGLLPRVALLGDPERLTGDALAHYELLWKFGCPVETLTDPSWLAEGEVLVDALFGTGLTRPLEGVARQAVEACQGRPVLAVDIPSGICSRTGQVLGAAVQAQLTVTMGLPKRGLLLHPGAAHTGRLVVAEIGFPPALLSQAGQGEQLERAQIRSWLPARGPTSHKGSCGHALLVAGSDRYPGAAFLATEGALRAGAGLVTLATAPGVRAELASRLSSPLSLPLSGPRLHPEDRETLLAQKVSAYLIGCGLDLEPGAEELVRELARSWQPLVLDAGALRVVAGHGPLGEGRVLTPHPGEMASLLERPVAELEADRIESALECARRYQCVVVFKGAPTVIADQGQFWVNPTGTNVLSQGGTGDVLAGLITGLLAQGLDCQRAACCGVYLHGLAARLAGRQIGPRGVFADEIAARVPRALRRVLRART
ncbi:MAG: bifunctional NAD(P)H-hydrate repair enzyme Nnr [Candidatus Xenobia bacterium]